MAKGSKDSVEALVALGFTGLEAEVYAFLLQDSPATGYRIAQVIGKPVANTYKAIESLETKGAVLVDEGANRQCRAIPADELIARLDRAFAKKRERAAATLATLKAPDADDRVYQLRSLEQVFERCRAMLARAQVVALVDAFPDPMNELKDSLVDAGRRGITLGVKAYRPIEIEGVEVFVEPNGERIQRGWPGQWVNIVVDGHEHLFAFLTADGAGLHQAIWSGSAYLSWVYHSALASEITLAGILDDLSRNAPIERIRERREEYMRYFTRNEPGYRELMERFGRKD